MQETAQMLHRRVFPREQLEDFVSELAFSYPKCFVTDSQRLKRPLKKNIALDLEEGRVKGRGEGEGGGSGEGCGGESVVR